MFFVFSVPYIFVELCNICLANVFQSFEIDFSEQKWYYL